MRLSPSSGEVVFPSTGGVPRRGGVVFPSTGGVPRRGGVVEPSTRSSASAPHAL